MTQPEAPSPHDTQRRRSGSERRQRHAQQKTRFTPEEHAELRSRADAAGMSINGYIRHQTLGTAGPRSMKRLPIDQVLMRELLGQVARVGNNLNQLTRLANVGDLGDADVRALDKATDQTNDVLDAIMVALGRGR